MIPFRLVIAVCAPSLAWAACVTKQCKEFPGSPGWPSASDWSQLNSTVGGKLLKTVLPGGVCHEGQPNYNEDQCPEVAEEWTTFEFHAADPVSVMWDRWSNFTCLPDPQYPCTGQGYPSYVVNATAAKDVQAAIEFGKHASAPHITIPVDRPQLGGGTFVLS